MNCVLHGIAGGPDGRCAICHTQDEASSKREGARLGWILFLALGTASAALLGVRALMPSSGHSARQAHAEPTPAPARLAPPAPTVATVTAPATTTSEPPPSPFAAATPDAPEAPVAPTAETSAVAATAGPPPAPPPAERPPTDAEIRAAMVQTPITMYTAPWCGTCRRAHEFLKENGLSCVDRNIDDDPEAYRELKALSGGTAIPVIDVDGKVLRAGFNARAIATALSESVERRLRAQGVKIVPKAL